MSSTVREIAALLTKLKAAERAEVRVLLDRTEYAAWQKSTGRFRRLMRGRNKSVATPSEVVSSMRR